MEKPIHASTPPPATMKASRDTPNRCSNWVPMSAETVVLTVVASTALVASGTADRESDFPQCAQTLHHRSRGLPAGPRTVADGLELLFHKNCPSDAPISTKGKFADVVALSAFRLR